MSLKFASYSRRIVDDPLPGSLKMFQKIDAIQKQKNIGNKADSWLTRKSLAFSDQMTRILYAFHSKNTEIS